MNLKNIKQFEQYDSPEDDESYYHDDDYLFGRPNHSKKKSIYDDDDDFYEDDGYRRLNKDYNDEDDDSVDTNDSDDMSHLLYLLRQMFKNGGIDVEITSDDLDVTIDAYLNRKERLKDLIKVFEVAKKLKKDILPQYDSEFQLYYSKTGQPILTFKFTYGDGEDDDNSPF